MQDWLPSDDEICDTMRWNRGRRSAALDAAGYYVAAIARLVHEWKEPTNARFLRLENGTASWAPVGRAPSTDAWRWLFTAAPQLA